MNQTQWIILAIVIYVLVQVWKQNKKNNVEGEAPKSKYSNANSYKHITAMKHDIFKQLTIDIVPLLLLGIISIRDVISINKFEESPLGKSLLTGIGYTIFYQYVQPYIVNSLPNF